MSMTDNRWTAKAVGLVAGGALLAWILFSLFPLDFDRAKDAPEQALAKGEPVDGNVEPALYGVVKSVDVDHRRVTLAIGTEDGKQQEKTYELAKDAEVLLEGPATLAELAAETRVGLVFGPDGKEVVAIRSEPFLITVEPKQHEVEVGKPFDVILRVTNASPTPQSFWVMLTTWDMHWRSNNARINWDSFNSYRNAPIPIKLAPGEIYEKTLAMSATAPGHVSFKMGFTPLADKRMGVLDKRLNSYGEVRMKLNLSERTFWSQEVEVYSKLEFHVSGGARDAK
jgi:hypothetical protein